MADTFFITTAIDYTNGAPHIGHAYEKVLADVLARYHRLKGDEVFYLTGVDQHGQKVQQSAEKQGIAPQDFVDGLTAKFVALWDKLDVRYDGWAATTDELHKQCVRANLQMLWDDQDPATGESRWIYKKSEGGYYSVRQEQFLTDKERGADGEFGPEWGQVEFREEENFYFRLKEHKPWLLDFINKRSAEGNPFVVPEFRVPELRNAVEKLDGDLCISRPAARLQWGIPFPESWGAGFVTFVWFDALVNYISFAPGHDPAYAERMKDEGGRMKSRVEDQNDAPPSSPAAAGPSSSSFIPRPSSFAALWPPLHVIGKDIMIPAHGVYWPIMLKALGFPDDEMPTLLVHGFWNVRSREGLSEKMSKTTGNVIDPDKYADKYGAEAVRYYLMSDIATGKDADFSEERLIQCYNTDLANSLGNLLNRSLSMAAKYRSGTLSKDSFFNDPQVASFYAVEKPEGAVPEKLAGVGAEFWARVGPFEHNHAPRTTRMNRKWFDHHQVSSALEFGIAFATELNAFIEATAPWKLAKGPAYADRLDAVLYTLAESLRIIAILLSPVLPKAAQGIFDQLNWKMEEQGQETRFKLTDAQWGGLPDGHQLGQPTPLFPRIEAPAL